MPRPPPSHAPLAALAVAVIDLETTGLDVRRDRVVEVAALTMTGARIEAEPRIEQKVNPGVPVPARAAAIHGLRDAELQHMPAFATVASTLRGFLSGRIVVGHHVGFDLAILRHEAARIGLAWEEPVALDLASLMGALDPSLPDLGLEAVAAYLGVEVERRHRAMGDALTAARCFAALIGRLRELDVRTLGEAQSFAARRSDLLLSQVRAGWSSIPGEGSAAPRADRSISRVDAFVFERSLSQVMSTPPIFVAVDSSLREAAQQMVQHGIGAVLVGDDKSRSARGILTERDLLRVAAAGGDPDRLTASAVMSRPVESMPATEMLYRALGHMDRRGIRHLCVVDSAGTAIGMLSQRDLLHHRTASAHSLGSGIRVASDGPDLALQHAEVARVAGLLQREGLGGAEIARIVSNEIRALTERAAEIAVSRLQSRGRGPAPAPWCLMVLGSAGRGESLLGSDQDNALIHGGSDADAPWFAELGSAVAQLLDEAGISLCKGGVMAANRQWRGTPEQWRLRVQEWLGRARPEDLMNVDIFFDMTPVAGELEMARALHHEAVIAAQRAPAFIGLLAQSAMSFAPIFGFWGRPARKEGRIDLKRSGLLPLVGLSRVLALRSQSSARATADRLREAAAAGRLSDADAEHLVSVHADLLEWILRQQLVDLANGVQPTGRVEVTMLNRKEVDRLRRGLHRIDEVLQDLPGAVAG